ncbi:MAG TPA: aldehyde dehydrogenase (NADP(+)) [Planctomycetota bacterium]|nr:aldehyde dehydrogenase (NADP(+)) [Planctomycetota bacterium]
MSNVAREPHGANLIAGERVVGTGASWHAIAAAGGAKLPGSFRDADDDQIDRALRLADESFDSFRATPVAVLEKFLEQIALEIEALGDALLQRAHEETGLPLARLTMERGRTMAQARMFAQVVREGSWVDAVIDTALPDRKPQPRPDIRRKLVPLGPVVVFGASNFPLAISVASCDTLGAFAVGCPVVVKAHPSHAGTCEMIAEAILSAGRACGLPAGFFSLVHGKEHGVGLALVRHPLTRAVAFTGSEKAGRALFDAAAARLEPIPVYAEMGSTNPIFVLPGALAERAENIAEGFVQSMSLGVGQFCTQPGLLIGVRSPEFSKTAASITEKAAKIPAATMLNAGICAGFHEGVAKVRAIPGVQVLTPETSEKSSATPVVVKVGARTFAANEALRHEVFGPFSIIIECDDLAEMLALARNLNGQLTATIHATAAELQEHATLVRILERKAGRIVFNGFPTGVEVCAAMHHGGPYPASTHSFFNSIGSSSLLRFVRPVAYQSFPDAALPLELQASNPRGIVRRVDGRVDK